MSVDTFMSAKQIKELLFNDWANEYFELVREYPRVRNYDELLNCIYENTGERLAEKIRTISSFSDLDIILEEEISNQIICGSQQLYEYLKKDLWQKLQVRLEKKFSAGGTTSNVQSQN